MTWQALIFTSLLLSSIVTVNYSYADSKTSIGGVLDDPTFGWIKNGKLMPPKQQIVSGISFEQIRCDTYLILIKKSSDNSPACVKPDTAQKLAERGWGVLKEPMVWFVYYPIACQLTPWANQLNNLTMGYIPERMKVDDYFKNQGITILDAKYVPQLTTTQLRMPTCGSPLENPIYFLVSESDSHKMIKLGYKELTTPLPPNTDSFR
jgi:hypothetical protein